MNILVGQIPNDYALEQDGSDVACILEMLGTDAQSDGYTYIFTQQHEGCVTGAYGTYSLSVTATAYLIV